MSESAAFRALREAVSTVSSRRLKDSQLPALGYAPRRRRPAAERLSAARTPALGAMGRAAVSLRSGDTSCKELLEASLAAAEAADPKLNAFASLDAGAARDQAARLDEELAGGSTRGPLHGIPISVGDSIAAAGLPTRAGSAAYRAMPEEDAPAVARLRESGAVILGKTVVSEFGLGSTTPAVRHHLDPSRVPGGSAGGPAAAVASGMGLGAIAADARGCTRIAGALSGVAGVRPTAGTAPSGGLVQVSWSLDEVGALAGSVPDAALLLDALTGSELFAYAGADVSGLRVGLPPDSTADIDYGVLGGFSIALQRLVLVASVNEVARPSTLDFSTGNAAGLVLTASEAAAYHRRLGLDRSKCRQSTRDQLQAAERVTALDYLDAQRLRGALAAAMLRVFEEVDVLVMPAALVPAPREEEAEEHLSVLTRNTMLWSLIGFPALSVPCGTTGTGLPVGMQMVAPPHEEASLVALGSAFERAQL